MKNTTYKRILVTGGAGFMGSAFIRNLYKTHPTYTIVNVDALTYAGNLQNVQEVTAKEKSLPAHKQRYVFVRGRVGDTELLRHLFKKYKFDGVVHFAAETHVDRSFSSATDFIVSNVAGTYALLEVARQFPIKRFVHISTDEVYGNVLTGTSVEDAPLNPTNPYAITKAGADALVRSYGRAYNLPYLIVRSSNNFGPYQYPEKLIPITIINLLHGKKVPVYGDGTQLRSWLYVDDFCNAVTLLMHRAEPKQVFNIAGEHRKNKEVVEAIAAVLGKKFTRSVRFVPDRPDTDLRYAPSAKKITTRYGWKPAHAFDEELVATVHWYRNHEAWWQHAVK